MSQGSALSVFSIYSQHRTWPLCGLCVPRWLRALLISKYSVLYEYTDLRSHHVRTLGTIYKRPTRASEPDVHTHMQ